MFFCPANKKHAACSLVTTSDVYPFLMDNCPKVNRISKEFIEGSQWPITMSGEVLKIGYAMITAERRWPGYDRWLRVCACVHLAKSRQFTAPHSTEEAFTLHSRAISRIRRRQFGENGVEEVLISDRSLEIHSAECRVCRHDSGIKVTARRHGVPRRRQERQLRPNRCTSGKGTRGKFGMCSERGCLGK